MTEPHPPVDRFGFWVHFVCGALLGGLVWLSIPSLSSMVGRDGCLTLGGCSMFFGLLAGRFGDRFWHAFMRWWMW